MLVFGGSKPGKDGFQCELVNLLLVPGLLQVLLLTLMLLPSQRLADQRQ